MHNLSLIIPFFNEERRVDISLPILIDYLEDKSDIEIIYVNDGSTDYTQFKLEKMIQAHQERLLKKNIHFKIHPLLQNKGKGGAIIEGVKIAQGKYIAYTDFDFAISLTEIKNFLSVFESNPSASAVIASRRVSNKVLKRQSFLRKIFGRVFNILMKIIIYLPIKDTQCGFKMFKKEIAHEIFPKVGITGFAFDVEVLKRIQKGNYQIFEQGVEITHDDKFSTVNIFSDPIKMLWDLLKLRWRLFFDR